MKVLFISSANRTEISPIVKAQGESLKNIGVSVEYFGVRGKGVLGYLSNIPRLRKYVKKVKPDLLHVHYSLSGIMTGLAFINLPIIISLMGSDTKVEGLQRKITLFFAKNFWDKIIVKSDSMKKDLGLQKVSVIPNGVDISLFRPLQGSGLKNYFGFSSSKKTVLFFSNPGREEKNFPLANDAFSLIDDEGVDLKVKYNIAHESVPQLLNAADVLLLSSKWEGSPNAVKEAMACNCPVVASDVGDVSWLFGDEPGYFLTGFEATDVAEKLKEALLFSGKYKRTNGRKRLIELELDSVSVAGKLVEVYKRVLDDR